MNAISILSIAIPVAVLAGLIASTGSVMFVGGFASAALAVALLFAPRTLFALLLIFSLVLSGVAEFYFGIGQANWVPSLLGLALFPAAALCFGRHGGKAMKSSMPGVRWTVGAYVLALIASSLINANPMNQLLVGIRSYYPFVGILVALQCFANSDADLKRWAKALVAIGLVQLPFCVHQAIFVAPKRASSFSAVGGGAESIVGSFGGNPLGGGYTGEMAVFVLLAACLALALTPLLRQGRLLSVAMCIVALCCVGMAETKIVFVLTPIALILVFLEELRASPARTFGMLVAMAIALGGLGAVYAWRFWSKGPGEFWHAFTYSFDPNFMVDAYHRGRIAALFHWWDNNIIRFDFLGAFLGHGMASTLEASRIIGEGTAVRAFGLGLDSHAASKLLWDAGLLGFGLFAWIILRTGLNAHRLVHTESVPEFHRQVMKTARAAMFCFAAMLPYQVSVVGGAAMQFLFWFFVGYVEYCRSHMTRGRGWSA